MFEFPRAAQPLMGSLSIAFTRPTFKRFSALFVGAVLASGRRTLTEIQWTVFGLVPGHFSSFHRVFSRARWSLWPLGKALTRHALRLVPEGQPVLVAMDDTVTRHSGPKIHGRGCHRDATRSSHAITTLCWGHRWVVLAILVKLPLISRPWALPVLCALYVSREVAAAEGQRFRTPCELAATLACVLVRWFPQHRFVFLGDGGFSSFALARRIDRRGGTLVARYYDDAAIFEPAPPWPPRGSGHRGRKPIKGKALPRPGEAAAAKRGRCVTVNWYGGGRRRVELVDGKGMWYRSGRGVIAVQLGACA